MSTPRTRRRGRLWQGAAVALAAALTATLAQSTTSAAFTAQTTDGSNQVTASPDFCPAGGTTLIATADTTGYQANPTAAYGSEVEIGVGSQNNSNGRALLRFDLPSLPTYCTLTGAKLRLYARTTSGARQIDAYRIDPAATWSEATTNWNNLPATTGTAVAFATSPTTGWQEWPDVVSLVTAMYANGNNGFLLRDRNENMVNHWQVYSARENATTANRPQLVLTWG